MGSVKRRLAQDIGDGAALRFYRTAAAKTLRLAGDKRWRTTVALAPERALRRGQANLRALTARRCEIVGQGTGNLGKRMARSIVHFAPSPIVIVGTDIPDMNANHVARAFRLLRGHDAVFGPAADGGFWLVGLRQPQMSMRVFANVRWSSSHALADVRANLPARARIAMIETLEDVDDGASYRRRMKSCVR